jgi:hypothetical protein
MLVLTNNKLKALKVWEGGGGGEEEERAAANPRRRPDPLPSQDLDPLAALPRLTHLVLVDNEVTKHPQYRCEGGEGTRGGWGWSRVGDPRKKQNAPPTPPPPSRLPSQYAIHKLRSLTRRACGSRVRVAAEGKGQCCGGDCCALRRHGGAAAG